MNRDPFMSRLLLAACGFAALGIAAGLWGYLAWPEAFFTAWLCAFFYWLAMPVGALALLMIHNLTGGKWETVARPPLEAAAATMPLFILLFLPVVAGMGTLYSWSRPELAGTVKNGWYLNAGFFGLRAAVYFVIWNGLALLQLARLRGAAGAPPSAQWMSGIGLLLLGYSFTYAAIDWLMSTEPAWFSTVYPMMIGAGEFVASLSLVLLTVTLAARPRGLDAESFARQLASLATILLAVDIFWAYTCFSQWLIVWEENLRAEIPWYIERMRDGWESLLYTIAGAHFFVPFFALVWTPAKRSRALVGGVAALLLLAHLLQLWWLVLPPFHRTGFTWLDPFIALGIGGVWVCAFLWRLRYGRFWPQRLRTQEGLVDG
jgi:hypothetical protein